MGLSFHKDETVLPDGVRPHGFDRYRQLLGNYADRWLLVNLITLAGALPLALGILYALLSSSLLVLLPVSLLGGLFFGPFLACLMDSLLRGFRDASGSWHQQFARAWRQNWKESLLPGALLGFFFGNMAFMGYVLYSAQVRPGVATVLLYLFSALLLFMVNTLYWPQLVLFNQSNTVRLKNTLLFCIRHFWQVLGVAALQLAYLAALVLFAPWSLMLLPITGFWYILFIALFLLYEQLDRTFSIEERFQAAARKAGEQKEGQT